MIEALGLAVKKVLIEGTGLEAFFDFEALKESRKK